MANLKVAKLSNYVKTVANQYFEHGYAVVRGFLTMSDISKISAESDSILEKHWNQIEKKVLLANDDLKVVSGDYVFKLNPNAFDEKRELKCPKRNAVQHVGWKLHSVSDLFKRITFEEENKRILKYLNFRSPVLFQSGIVYKAPGISPLDLHQDDGYLNNEPKGHAVNFWVAIDDANEDSGCLHIAPGSHRTVNCRKVGQTDKNAYSDIDTSKLVKVPVKKGDLILLNSLVVHGNGENRTNNLRRALAFSVYDKHRVEWSKHNSIQDGSTYNFAQLY